MRRLKYHFLHFHQFFHRNYSNRKETIQNSLHNRNLHSPGTSKVWAKVMKKMQGFPGGTVVKNPPAGTSLVAQWLRIYLPMQGTRVQALVRDDPICRGATKPMCHNYWACALEPVSHNYWACMPQLLEPTRLEPVLSNKRSHCNEKPAHCNKE